MRSCINYKEEDHVDLKGKKFIVLGERDGVQGKALAACVTAAGGTVVLSLNQCFV